LSPLRWKIWDLFNETELQNEIPPSKTAHQSRSSSFSLKQKGWWAVSVQFRAPLLAEPIIHFLDAGAEPIADSTRLLAGTPQNHFDSGTAAHPATCLSVIASPVRFVGRMACGTRPERQWQRCVQ